MRLYMVQHAEAKKEDEDPARPLSQKGWKDIERVSNFLRGKGIRVSRILNSGKLRAKQTAEKLGGAVHSSEGVKETDGLSPLDDPSIWEKRLKDETKDVIIVGHLPHLSRLTGLLLIEDPNRNLVGFKMGGIICLERDETENWLVSWMIIPQIL